MKEMDCVEVITEKEKYAKDGVHQGMQGWICHSECIYGYWLGQFTRNYTQTTKRGLLTTNKG